MPPDKVRRRSSLRVRVAGVGLALVAAVAAAHTPPARAFVFRQAASLLAKSLGIDVRAAELRYNVLTLSFELRDMSVAARTSPGQPFLRADALAARLGVRTLLGNPQVTHIALRLPRISVVRRADGSTNLPASSFGRSDASGVTMPEMELADLGVTIEIGETRIVARDLSAILMRTSSQTLRGQLEVPGGVAITAGGTTIDTATGRASVSFDGSALTIDELDLRRPGMTVSARGTLDVRAEPRLDLAITGATSLASWAPESWAIPLQGVVDIRARVTGLLTHPIVALEADSSALDSPVLGAVTLSGTANWLNGALTIEGVSIRSASGDLDIHGAIKLDAGTGNRLEAQWTHVDAERIAAGLSVPATPLNGVTSSGSAAVTWQGAAAPATDGRMVVESSITLVAHGERSDLRVGASQQHRGWRVKVEAGDAPAWALKLDADVRPTGVAWRTPWIVGSLALRAPVAQRLVERLRAFALLPRGVDADAMSGSISADATFAGPLLRITATGQVRGRSVTVGGSPPVDGESDFSLDLLNRRTTGSLHLVTKIDAWSQPWQVRTGGALILGGKWSGALNEPNLAFVVESRDLSIEALGPVELVAEGRASPEAIELDRVSVDQPAGGVLTGSGRYDFRARLLALNAEGRDLQGTLFDERAGNNVHPVRLAGASVNAVLSGPLDDLHGHSTLSIGSTNVGLQSFGRVDVELTLDQGVLTATMKAPTVGLAADTSVRMSAPYTFRFHGTLKDLEISRLIAASGVVNEPLTDTEGMIRSTFDMTGDLRDLSASVATLEIEPVRARIHGVAIRAPRPARVTVAERRIRLDPVSLVVGEVTIRAEAEFHTADLQGVLTLHLGGDFDGSAPLLSAAAEAPVEGAGRIAGTIHIRRSRDGLAIAGRIESEVHRLRRGDSNLLDNLQVEVDFDDSQVLVRAPSLSARGAQLRGTVSVPLSWANHWLPDGWQFTSAIDDIATVDAALSSSVASLLVIAGLVPDERVTGEVSIEAHLRAANPAIDAVSGEVRMNRGDLATPAVSLQQVQPTLVRIAKGVLTIDTMNWRGPGNVLTATGAIGLSDQVDSRLAIELDGDLRLIDAVLPGRLTGRLSGSLTLKRERGAWGTDLAATLTDGNWLLPDAGVLFADWSGRLDLAEDHLELSGFEGRINDGRVRMGGQLSFDQETVGSIQVEADNILLNIPAGLSSQASARLTWQSARGRESPALTGDITVTANRYSEPVTRMLELVDTLSPAASRDGESVVPGWLAATTVDVAVDVTDPVIIENSLGSVELTPNLHLTGSLGTPALRGTIDAIDNGQVRIGGREYRLRESSLIFSPANGLMPTFNALGETTIGDYEVQVRVDGTPDRIELSYSSSPPLSQLELRRLLLTGQTQSGADDEAEAGAALATASADVLGFAGKFIGLDSVRVGTADLDVAAKDRNTATHLTVSKKFGRTTEVVVSDNLETGSFTWLLVTHPYAGYEVRLASVEGNEQSLELRRERLFGPGGTVVSRGARASAPSARAVVADVMIAGRPGFDRAEVSRALRLSAGDRFDVRLWTDDRLRLERFYRDRGFHRVRIVPRRTDAIDSDGTRLVTLHYEIDRGPLTVVDTAGDRLSEAALNAMYNAWRGIPITEVLESEFLGIARRDLIRRNYFQADVEIEFLSDTAELAHATARVRQGPRVKHRAIRWSGNETVTTSDLDAIAASYLVDNSAWVDSQSVVRDVKARYARDGRFNAKVTVGDSKFEQDAAILPITIDEGPQTILRDIEVEGVAPARLDQARAVLGVVLGRPIGSDDTANAERRLKALYANLGYRDVQVSARLERPDASATLTVSVREGLPSIIERVEVTGAESTAPSLVADALTLQPGGPASPSEAETTRRNLYDIGSFRRVDVSFDQAPPDPSRPLTRGVTAAVLAEELRRYQLRYGFQIARDSLFSTEDNKSYLFGGTVEIRDRNFLRRGMLASAGLRYDPHVRVITLLFSAPANRRRAVRTNIFARDREQLIPIAGNAEVRTFSREVTFEQQWQATPSVRLTWGYEIGREALRLSSPEFGTIDFPGLLTGPIATVAVDRRDALLDARRGWFHSTSVQTGFTAFGSDLGYYRLLMQQEQFIPVGPLTLAGNLRWGLVRGFAGSPPLSAIDLLFQAGGTHSVRGYPQDYLSAVEIPGVPIRLGGTQMLVLNGEARFPVWKWLQGAMFVDAGNTFVENIRLLDLATGVGVGLRVRTPLATFRIDLGYPTSSQFGVSGARWHFSVGQMF